MGRRSAWAYRQAEREREARQRVNPIWRGVGCLLVIIMAVIGWFFASWFINSGLIYLPPQLLNPPSPFPGFLGGGNLVRLVVSGLFMLTGFGVLNFVYAILFPIKPGEYDLPTPKRKPPQRKGRKRY